MLQEGGGGREGGEGGGGIDRRGGMNGACLARAHEAATHRVEDFLVHVPHGATAGRRVSGLVWRAQRFFWLSRRLFQLPRGFDHFLGCFLFLFLFFLWLQKRKGDLLSAQRRKEANRVFFRETQRDQDKLYSDDEYATAL